MTTHIMLVGGFLGAGKTTLLGQCARRLTEGSSWVALITNDQAEELVDTAVLERVNDQVYEVSGSCFCCDFNGLTEAIGQATNLRCDVVIGEPVGSCTDLSATILQPLKHRFAGELTVAPLSVMVDPDRLADLLAGGNAGLHESAAYILRKQLEEADIILVNKTDLLDEAQVQRLVDGTAQAWPKAKVYAMSAKTGAGVTEWLDEVSTTTGGGGHVIEVDYDIYAEGEAVLGWLNASYLLHAEEPGWDRFAERLLGALSARIQQRQASVGHVKLLLEHDQQYIMGNLTGGAGSVSVRGEDLPSTDVKLTLNARVEMSPEELRQLAEEALSEACGDDVTASPHVSRSLSPGRPVPTFRYEQVVS